MPMVLIKALGGIIDGIYQDCVRCDIGSLSTRDGEG
jgi:hypothetical protein